MKRLVPYTSSSRVQESIDKSSKDITNKMTAGVLTDFLPALKEIAKLGSINTGPDGKYTRGSWTIMDPDKGLELYTDAFWRHLLEGPKAVDSENGMPHDVAIAWNALALIYFRLKKEELLR